MVRAAQDTLAVLTDQTAVTQAQADLTAATLTAPIAGTVGQITLVEGQRSGSDSVVIIGAGAAQVSFSVPLVDMALVHAGLVASVVPAGSVTNVPGSVQSVNLLPASLTSSTPSYPATVLVPDAPQSVATGSTAMVDITVASAANTLRVPVSALAGLSSGTSTVDVVSGTNATSTAVTVGAVGGGWAQIVKGLNSGERVAVADAAQPLPTNQTQLGRGFGGGGTAGGTGGRGTGGSGGRTGSGG